MTFKNENDIWIGTKNEIIAKIENDGLVEIGHNNSDSLILRIRENKSSNEDYTFFHYKYANENGEVFSKQQKVRLVDEDGNFIPPSPVCVFEPFDEACAVAAVAESLFKIVCKTYKENPEDVTSTMLSNEYFQELMIDMAYISNYSKAKLYASRTPIVIHEFNSTEKTTYILARNLEKYLGDENFTIYIHSVSFDGRVFSINKNKLSKKFEPADIREHYEVRCLIIDGDGKPVK